MVQFVWGGVVFGLLIIAGSIAISYFLSTVNYEASYKTHIIAEWTIWSCILVIAIGLFLSIADGKQWKLVDPTSTVMPTTTVLPGR